MQKLYITFPDGAPGIGIMLLRFAVGATLVAIATGSRAPPLPALIVMSGFVLTLLMGFMTRISAVLVALFLGMYGASGGFAGGPLEAATIAHSLALALLGPGAYSIDSRLFGRRRVIFESRKLDGED